MYVMNCFIIRPPAEASLNMSCAVVSTWRHSARYLSTNLKMCLCYFLHHPYYFRYFRYNNIWSQKVLSSFYLKIGKKFHLLYFIYITVHFYTHHSKNSSVIKFYLIVMVTFNLYSYFYVGVCSARVREISSNKIMFASKAEF